MSQSVSATDEKSVLHWVRENKDGESSEVGLASGLYAACLRTLGLLSKHYLATTKPSRERKARLVESHTRLCLFGDDLLSEGALDHCLKGDDDLRDEVISLLYSLGKVLLRGPDSLSHVQGLLDTKTKYEIESGLAHLVDNASIVASHQDEPRDALPSDSDNSEDEDSNVNCDIRRPTDDDDILSALDTYTTSLMDLRPVLEQSLSDLARPSVRRADIAPPNFEVTESARPYVLQVHDKFRNANSDLVERLGEANWQRYVRIKARMAICPQVDTPGDTEVPKSMFQPVSLFHDSGLGTSLPNRSQYAASDVSHTSFLTTATDVSKGRLRFPSTPVEVGEGKTFICHICTRPISGLRNRVDWKIHVLADLHPYICTFRDCPSMLTTYLTRKAWAEHEFEAHRSHQRYECHDCSRTFSSEKKFVEHASSDHHSENLNHTQLLAILSAAKRSDPTPLSQQNCPLCQKSGWQFQQDFVTHLGKHLEDIALFALPRGDDDTDLDSSSEVETVRGERVHSLPLDIAVTGKQIVWSLDGQEVKLPQTQRRRTPQQHEENSIVCKPGACRRCRRGRRKCHPSHHGD